MGQLSTFNEATNEPGTIVITFSMIGLTFMKYHTGPLTIPTNEYGKLGSTRGGGINWNVYKKSSFVRLSNISLAYNRSNCTHPKMEN